MLFIEEKLREVPQEERRELAERLFRNFRGSEYIPRGYFHPKDWDGNYIKKALAQERNFYRRLERIVDNPPEEFYDAKRKFGKAYRQMLRFATMQDRERRNSPLHLWPEYIYDFHESVQSGFTDRRGTRSNFVRNLTFLPKQIGKGGFTEIYLAQDKEGKQYAVKLSHYLQAYNEWARRGQQRIISTIKDNLNRKKGLLTPFFFTQLYEVSPAEYGEAIAIIEYFDGNPVEKDLECITQDEERTGIVLLTYADMLVHLHGQGHVYLDNSWSNVLVKEKEVKICDYDFISDPENIHDRDFLGVYTPLTASREQILQERLSLASDLEGFALMLDRFYNGNYMVESLENRRVHEMQAKTNQRVYPKERKAKLPRKLREIVHSQIHYPKEEGVTAQHFRAAIKEAYHI